MKILIVSSYLPYPLINGGHIRLYNLIKMLSKKHKITLICEIRGFQTDKDIEEMRTFCDDVITVERKRQWTKQNILKAGFSPDPFLVVGHTLPEMKTKIVELMLKKAFDVIHVETFYVMQNVPQTYVPIVLVEHNVEYLVYKRYADTAQFYVRPLLYADIFKIQSQERRMWKKAQALVAVSDEEARIMKRPDVFVVPNGVDITKFKMQNPRLKMSRKEKKVLFIGDFKWIQNRESVAWILKEIWPKIQSERVGKNSDLVLWIVGKNIPENLKVRGDKTIIFDENASEQTEKIFQQAALLLAPIRVGGGTQYKILEAMSSGTPVVTTNLGAEGMKCNPKKDLLVADKAEDIARLVTGILHDRDQYEAVALNARACIEKYYSWEIISEKLNKVYDSVVAQ